MAKNIMIQGTMSNAGKSLLVAGILRVLKQDGYRVAPFKSQNMALNSYITKEGLEMGRAQVMQAEAAGIAPQVCMNPILLKPTSDVGSQVIVNGEVRGNYSAADYFKKKKMLIPDIMAAYHKLEEQADIIVIEGAGSPAEINLKQDDIVNMGLAKLVDAPVLLVGDIDRGGVFAQLLGTVLLLEEEERARIKGFIINKFRGDAALLEPGPSMLYERCGIETLGVVPYLRIQIDDEDSLSEQLTCREDWAAGMDVQNSADYGTDGGVDHGTDDGIDHGSDNSADHGTDHDAGHGEKRPAEAVGTAAPLRIAVIKLPHISNFTDFNPLNRFTFVSVQYVDKAEQLARVAAGTGTDRADLIILPGSKNTIQDMKWLRESGMEAAILKQAARGGRIMGICGGYQMLGGKICDPCGVEVPGGGEIRGMGLLPVTTVLREQKRRSRITGNVCGAGADGKPGTGITRAEISEDKVWQLQKQLPEGVLEQSQNQQEPPQGQLTEQSQAQRQQEQLQKEKGQKEESAWRLIQGIPVSGYEIHMGESRIVPDGNMENGNTESPSAFCMLADGRADGCIQGRILGTYLHGIFEEEAFTQKMIETLRSDRGISGTKHSNTQNRNETFATVQHRTASIQSYRDFKESQYDLLADAVRQALDMDRLYQIIFGK